MRRQQRLSANSAVLGAGFVLALEATLLSAAVLLGWIPFEASSGPSRVETSIAQAALSSGIRRRTVTLRNPYQPDLLRGMRLYKGACAGCHGLPDGRNNPYGQAFYPPALQFAKDAPRRSEAELYYLMKHGIRMTGMPAWDGLMEDGQMWDIAAFLSRLDSLPPEVDAAWNRREAAASQQPGEH